MTYDYDVIVAGGGPAGSSTANFLRQAGRSVLVLERERFPRFHIGESMLPFANDIWKELGVLDRMDVTYMRKPGAQFIHEESGEEFTYYFDTAIRPGRPYAFQVKRADFDKLLLDRARELGADVREATSVEDVQISADGVRVTSVYDKVSSEHTAQLFIDATGRDALIAGRRQLKVADDVVTTNVAVYTTYRNVVRPEGSKEGNIIIGLFDGGWWWLIPFKDGDTSCGLVFEKSYTRARKGSSPEEMMNEAIDGLPFLKRTLAGAERIYKVDAQANWSYRSQKFYGERLMLVGDAAAFVDPLFSTGVLLAVNGARFAARHADAALTDGDFNAERFAPYQNDCVVGMDLFKNLVHEFYSHNLRKVLMASARNPTVCAVITSLLAGDVYHQAMWQSVAKRSGFSDAFDGSKPTFVRSSRQARVTPTS